MHKIKGNLSKKFAYEQYDMMHVKISSKHYNMHNDDMNYALKLSKNNRLNA